ncbi:hypothetical protein [Hydrogenophaga sp. 5NK40-0174]|uniref:hypothetical protein n=1 Tax=Hydrogenophaga sp. 5NK40-0174 TaxID=3127649 RepID=UPI00310BEE18
MRIIFGLISLVCALFIVMWLAKSQVEPRQAELPEVLKETAAEDLAKDINQGATPAQIQEKYRDQINDLVKSRDQQLKDY